MKRIFLLANTLIVMVLTGCNTPKNAVSPPFAPLPQSFMGSTDTTNTGCVPWSLFFKDSVLTSLIDSALKNNLDKKIAEQQIEIAKANLRSSKGVLFPTLSAKINSGITKNGQYTPAWAGNNGINIYKNEKVPEYIPDYIGAIQSDWEIDIWGRLRNLKKAAFYAYLSGNEGRNLTTTNLVGAVATNYYQLVTLDKQLNIIRHSIILQDSALSIVKTQKQAGMANDLGVKQFEAQVLHSKNLEQITLQNREACQNNLNMLLGRYPQPIERSVHALETEPLSLIKAGIPSALLLNRPDIRQAEDELLAAKANLRAAKSALFPSLNITGTVGYEAFRPNLITSPQSMALNALGGLIAPVINRSALKSAFMTANSMQLQALYNYEKSIINGFTEVRNNISGLNYSNEALSLKTKEAAILEQSMTAALNLFKTGRASYLEILNIEQNILQTEMELCDAQKDQAISLVAIYRSLGGGWR